MSRNKKIIIAVVALIVIALGRRLRVVVAAFDRAHRDGRGDPHARPRGDRLRVREDSAEALRQHQRGHIGHGSSIWRSTKATAWLSASSSCRSIRARCAPASRADRRRCSGAEAALDQARQGVETARVQLTIAQQNLKRQQELWKQQLTPREVLERAENDVRIAQSTLVEREKQVRTQEVRLGQDRAQLASAQFDLSKVRIESPIAGIVTRRNIQEGETAVVGTMNNAGTVLLTVADMSVIQAEVEVDETNIPNVVLGQTAKITIDAIPDRTFKGHVTEIGNSPIQTTGQAARTSRPRTSKSWSCSTRTCRTSVPASRARRRSRPPLARTSVAVPIPAVAVRELVYDAKGQVVKPPRQDEQGPDSSPQPRRSSSSPDRRGRRPTACS